MATRTERASERRVMWRDAATSRLMYRLNIAGASVYGGLSVFLSSTYELWGPDLPLGHLVPEAASVVVAIWGVLGALLCLTDLRLRTRADRIASLLPFALAALSAWICQQRYWQQL
ncbi:hypothetical protein J5226_20070 [Lysobacter sp. K5869]|uniref:hypothetical protein n=1 Tax=Lysobacter sp. K5869 TaxID=2820808 RepID=UPI001C0630CE|nr:hypothetical protein [Lysobacter sp. K5869]QWP75879.1 hypothetical protein J5226_20070 [Lysobacter sp. K5869]